MSSARKRTPRPVRGHYLFQEPILINYPAAKTKENKYSGTFLWHLIRRNTLHPDICSDNAKKSMLLCFGNFR